DADIDGEEEGSGTENYIALTSGTLKYLIFDRYQRFLCDVTAQAKTTVVNDVFTLYEVTAKLTDTYFIENTNNMLDFYILVLANVGTTSRNWRVTVPEMVPGVTTMESLFNDGLTMLGDANSGGLLETSTLMQPVTNATASRMPMAGLQHFSFHGSMLLTASENIPYDISLATGKNINMLRALAKIEIIDKINVGEGKVFDETEDDNGLRLNQPFLCGYMSEGSLLPSFSQWRDKNQVSYPETQQVDNPTVPSTASYDLPPSISTDNLEDINWTTASYARNFFKDQVATQAREDKCPVYSLYLYEYALLPIAQVPIDQQPYFVISTKGDDQNESLTFAVKMANYEDGTATTSLEQLLRNHIYR
ncbi:MAG: hypothetical protein K2K97_09690, partial [Muribaculaceae bacterium]|nr:hypothetical protein [Muribaculaceae bacterium]